MLGKLTIWHINKYLDNFILYIKNSLQILKTCVNVIANRLILNVVMDL